MLNVSFNVQRQKIFYFQTFEAISTIKYVPWFLQWSFRLKAIKMSLYLINNLDWNQIVQMTDSLNPQIYVYTIRLDTNKCILEVQLKLSAWFFLLQHVSLQQIIGLLVDHVTMNGILIHNSLVLFATTWSSNH